MNQAPLAQSADKQVLFARLGLTEQIHKLLLQEAQAGRDRLSRNSANLTDQSRADPSVSEPYKWDELSETAKHREILNIVSHASIHTSPFYSMGRYSTQVNEENWVARWYLWHSFRYRDNRDNRARAGAAHVNHTGQSRVHYWDPVHGIYR